MKQTPFVWITLAFCFGISFADLFCLNIQFFSILLLFDLILYYSIEKSYKSPQVQWIKTAVLLIGVAFFGIILYGIEKPENEERSLQNNYLEQDKLIIVIEAIAPTQGTYKKCEVAVSYLLRFQDTILIKDRLVLFLQDPLNQLKEYDICFVDAPIQRVANKYNPGEFDSEFFVIGLENV